MRIATSTQLPEGIEAAHNLTWRDQVLAHQTLDALDDMADLARPDPPKGS